MLDTGTTEWPTSLRVWLVHDWLTGLRGGEKDLLELVKLFPRARIATLVHVPGTTHPEIDKRVERVSFLNRMPGVANGWRNYLPLYPRAVRSLELDGYCDLVLSISHAVAKGVRVPRRKADGGVGTIGVPHICYCLTPMRYIWGMEDQYLSRWSWKRAALAAIRPYLRRFDRRNASVIKFVAQSHAAAERVRLRYGRESEIVYPGIDAEFYTPPTGEAKRDDFYLMIGALVGYKRVDLAVEAFCGMAQRKLMIIGTGPEEARLRRMAEGHANVEFLGRANDAVVRDHYRRCRAFIFPGEEDFGLTPVEAQACGAPVIAYRAGGAMETVIEGETGLFFERQTPEALCETIEKFEQCNLDAGACRRNALQFTWERFRAGIAAVVRKTLATN